MNLQIQEDIRKSKRKLSIFLDLSDSFSFSQNPLISIPEKKKKVSFFSQNQSTQNIRNILYKCNEYTVSICGLEIPYREIIYRRLFNK
jgi:hypothetical protein